MPAPTLPPNFSDFAAIASAANSKALQSIFGTYPKVMVALGAAMLGVAEILDKINIADVKAVTLVEADAAHLQKDITQSAKEMPILLDQIQDNLNAIGSQNKNTFAIHNHKELMTVYQPLKILVADVDKSDIAKKRAELISLITSFNHTDKQELYTKISALLNAKTAADHAKVKEYIATLQKSLQGILKENKSFDKNEQPLKAEVRDLLQKTVTVLDALGPVAKPTAPQPTPGSTPGG